MFFLKNSMNKVNRNKSYNSSQYNIDKNNRLKRYHINFMKKCQVHNYKFSLL